MHIIGDNLCKFPLGEGLQLGAVTLCIEHAWPSSMLVGVALVHLWFCTWKYLKGLSLMLKLLFYEMKKWYIADLALTDFPVIKLYTM